MGNTKSEFFEQVSVDPWWYDNAANIEEKVKEKTLSPNKMAEIKNEIHHLHQRRLKLIAEKKQEMNDLRQEVEQRKIENEELVRLLQQCNCEKVSLVQRTTNFEVPGSSKDLDFKNQVEEETNNEMENLKRENLQLQKQVSEMENRLENVVSEKESIENERKEYKTHVIALKDIITVAKQLLLLRDGQIKELSQKIEEIQASLAEKELNMFSDELRQEYEKQLKNMKQLRILYDERQRMDNAERNTVKNHLEEAKRSTEFHQAQNSELQARVNELEKEASENYDKITNLQSQLGLSKAECGDLKTELSVINQLFSQILVGFNNGQDINLDNLIKSLEENHDLLTQMFVNEEDISYTLPKVLLDLISQVNSKSNLVSEEETNSENQRESTSTLSTASEIVQNLPKVWKVLTELLSHQTAPVSVLNDDDTQGDKNPCYKLVETPNGQTLALSVSKTFIRLKDLIVEKKSLEKETMRLKQLNTHLETRLQDQEKRLELVSSELSKTWNVVGTMQKQHQQLHTQEKILRYELAQKRKLLNELKQELEYCREKWIQAREKNSHTEEQWKQLRSEFVARKSVIEEFNNSAESGYSDDRESSSSDDDDLSENKHVVDNNCKMDSIAELNESENGQAIFEVIQEEIENIENEISVSSSDESKCDEMSETKENLSMIDEDTSEIVQVVTEQSCHEEGDDQLSRLEEENISSVDEETPDIVQVVTEELEVESCHEDQLSRLEEDNLSAVDQEISDVAQIVTEELESCHEDQLSRLEEENLSAVDEEMSDVVQVVTEQLEVESCHETREERLTRLEEEAKTLLERTSKTSNRSIEICTKLDDLHEQYGCDSKSKRKDIADIYKKLEEDILQTIKKTQNGDLSQKCEEEIQLKEELKNAEFNEEDLCQAGTSVTKTPAEILAKREERLQNMEKQAELLVKKVQNNSVRGSQICNKLNVLHNRYGERRNSSADTEIKHLNESESGEVNDDIKIVQREEENDE